MKKFLIIGIPVVGLLALVGWKVKGKEDAAASLAKQQAAAAKAPQNVVVAIAGPKTVSQVITGTGSVTSPYNVNLSPQSAGQIQYLNVRIGDSVTTGETVVKVDPSAATGEVLAAEAALSQAKSKLAQAELTQNPNDVGIRSSIQQQNAAVEAAQANYSEAVASYNEQVASANSQIVDAQNKVASAKSALASANANLSSAKANLANAESVYNRTYQLYEESYVAAQDVDNAKTAVAVQKANVQVAQKSIESAQSGVNSAVALLSSQRNQSKIIEQKAKSDIAVAKASLDQAKASQRVAGANTVQIQAYQANIGALKDAVTAAQGQLQQAQSHLQNTNLVSPIDGVVTARNGDPGTLATPGQPIVQIQYLKWVYVNVGVPVDQAPLLHLGLSAHVHFDIPNKMDVDGTIAQINAAADPQSRQVTVQIKVQNSKGLLKPGMFGSVSIPTSTVNAQVYVPREALLSLSGEDGTVAVVDSSKTVHIAKVVVGPGDSNGYIITSGISPGDQVVTLSYAPPKEGDKVVVSKSLTGGAKS